jgi:hypothetical protein
MTGGSGEAVPTRRRRFQGGAGRAAGVNVNGRTRGGSFLVALRLRVCGPAAASCPSCQADAWGRGGVPLAAGMPLPGFQSCSAEGPADRLGGSGSRDVLVDRVQSSAAAARARANNTRARFGVSLFLLLLFFVKWFGVRHRQRLLQ